jgi:hypothetical protein
MEKSKVITEVTTKVNGKIILKHDDLTELMLFLNQSYDFQEKKGMELEGEHNIILDPGYELVLVSKYAFYSRCREVIRG